MPTFKGRFKGGTTEQWNIYDDPLHYREMGIEYTTDGRILFKFGIKTNGDVGTPWSQLSYASGPVGPPPEFEWDGTSIRFKRNDGTWGPWVNLQGPSAEYRWDGTSLQFKNPDGTWGIAVNLQGPQGEPGTAVPATSTSLGGMIPGAGFSISSEGVLSRDLLWSQDCDYPTSDWVVHNGIVYLWLAPSGPGVAGVGAKEPGATGSHAYWLDYAAAKKYELCEFYTFRHPTLKSGFQPAQGGLLANAATLYPEAWAYLQTVEGQKLCTTEAQWQTITRATWATLADGSKVGWNGIGGVPYYAPNTATGALRLPDLRGMYAEAAGFDSLGVGGVHGDGIPNISAAANFAAMYNPYSSGPVQISNTQGAFSALSTAAASSLQVGSGVIAASNKLVFLASGSVPVAAKNQPRAWGALPCVYLGQPAS